MFKFIASFWLKHFYRVKHKASLGDLNKLVEVVMSCSQPEHCDTAERYVQLYTDRYVTGKKEDGFTRTSIAVMKQFGLYLEDTREHAQRGMHTPRGSDKVVKTFPDMNNYVGNVLNVRFKLGWEKGVTSVLGPK